jgi:hypothetical protein
MESVLRIFSLDLVQAFLGNQTSGITACCLSLWICTTASVQHTPATVLALVESTALKYLDGNAMVIFPPMGTAVTGLKLKVTTPVFTVAGTLSTAAV